VSRSLGFLRVALVATAVSRVLAAAPNAGAAADSSEDELIRKGVEARRRLDDAAALELFKQAYAMHHGARAVGQMGLAEIALGRWVDAEAHLQEAIAASGDTWIKKNAKTLEEALGRVRQEVGSLSILGSPEGAEVIIGGEVRGTLPLDKPLRVRAGDVRFELRAPGHETEARTVRVMAGQLTRETVTLALLAPATPPPSAGPAPPVVTSAPPPRGDEGAPPATNGGAGLRTTGLVLAGAGVVAAGVGLAFGLKARSAGQSDSAAPTYDPGAASAGHRYQTLQFVGYGVGGALIAAGVTTFLIGRHRGQAGEPAPSVSFLPLTGGGVGLVGWRL
jgi:hypothetical protein